MESHSPSWHTQGSDKLRRRETFVEPRVVQAGLRTSHPIPPPSPKCRPHLWAPEPGSLRDAGFGGHIGVQTKRSQKPDLCPLCLSDASLRWNFLSCSFGSQGLVRFVLADRTFPRTPILSPQELPWSRPVFIPRGPGGRTHTTQHPPPRAASTGWTTV